MPPPIQRFGGAPNNLASHYHQQQYGQSQAAGLPPPSLASNPSFMNSHSMNNPFSINGNALSLSGGFGGGGLGMPGGTGLASQAAQMSFAAANLHQGHNGMVDPGLRAAATKNRIRDVWAGNLVEEMALIRTLVDRFPYIAMDTEFPGLVARPMGSFNGKSDYHYQCLRCNVDLLKMIQLGITMFTAEGECPPPQMSAAELGLNTTRDETRKFANQIIQIPTTWQFNFKFSLEDDMYSQVSIDALKLAGVDFARMETDGIDPEVFGALLMTSGLVGDEDVHWLSFHGGYDFGYLTKILRITHLPDNENAFDTYMKKYFPSIYDIKHLMKHAVRQHSGGQVTPLDPSNAEILVKFEQKASLEGVGDAFKIKRIGTAHTAGSDSLLTGRVFFKLKERIYNGEIGDEHNGRVWGLYAPEPNITGPGTIHANTQQYHGIQQENVTPGQNGYANGTPSTPNTGNAGLVSTPHNTNGGGVGPMTPGNMGGVFGSFSYNNK